MKKYSSLCYDGWYIQQGSHLHFLKLSSTKIFSTSFWKICFSKILLKIVSCMKIIISHPFLFLSNLYDLEKPSIKDIDSNKVSSSFVSVIARMSIYFSSVFSITQIYPTNTSRGFHFETTWKRSFSRRFNVESTWCVYRVLLIQSILKLPIIMLFAFPIRISFILLKGTAMQII